MFFSTKLVNNYLINNKTKIQIPGKFFPVQILAYKNYLLHAITDVGVPVVHKVWILGGNPLQILLRRCGIPISGLREFFLLSGTLEQI